MNCPKCNHQNKEINNFCEKCGAPLQMNNQHIQPSNTSSAMSTAAMILGIAGLVLTIVVIGIIPSIIGLVLGIIAIVTNKTHKGRAIAGVILAVLSVFLFLVLLVDTINGEDIEKNTNSTNESEEQIYEEIRDEDETEEKQGESKKKESNKNIQEDDKNEPEKEENIESKNEFILDLEKYLDESVAEQANDILINQIGFSSVEFDGRLDETSNYEIIVDGTYAVMTASDQVYRIFIPSSDYVFYENGSVLLTAKEFNDSVINSSDQSAYCIIAEEIVKSALIDPSSADFPSAVTNASDIAIEKSGDTVVVQSYVDSNNYYGQKVRTNYIVEFKVLNIDTFSYELIYANIGGEEYGTYIDI